MSTFNLAPLLAVALVACAQSQQSPEPEEAIDRIFSANDQNKDGCLSFGEWEIMTSLSDGAIKGQADNPEQFRQWNLDVFSEMELNNDKCVSKEEYLDFSRKTRTSGKI